MNNGIIVTLYFKVTGRTIEKHIATSSEAEAIANVEAIYGKHDILIKQVRALRNGYITALEQA